MIPVALLVASLAAFSVAFALAACQVCHDPWDMSCRPEAAPAPMRALIALHLALSVACLAAGLFLAVWQLLQT